MRNRSQDRHAGKLLMEFSRNQEIPKLVTIQEASRSKDARNKLLMQARTQLQPYKRSQNRQEMLTLNESLNQERKEKEQLRQAVRELTVELQKLRQVNEGLIVRVKEVQGAYRDLRSAQDKQLLEERRKLKNNIYSDVEEYVKTVVERLTLNLKVERMTPSVQGKLERFLAQLMEINSISVQQLVRRSRIQSVAIKPDPSIELQSRISNVGRYLTDYKTRQSKIDRQNDPVLPSREHYASIMQRLTGQGGMSKSYAGAGYPLSSASRQNKLRTIYATTPSKRKRIFE